jgi:hypothetical protein
MLRPITSDPMFMLSLTIDAREQLRRLE